MKLLLFDKHLSKYLSYLGYIKLLPLLIACVPSVFVTSFGSAVASVTIPTLKGLIHSVIYKNCFLKLSICYNRLSKNKSNVR